MKPAKQVNVHQFDRLLIAQAVVEDLSLVSADAKVLAYDVRKIDARK